MRTWLWLLLVSLMSVTAAGCRCGDGPTDEVVIYTSVDRVFSEPVLQQFEKQNPGMRLRMVFDTEETKSTGLLNRLVAEAATPRADVFWSGDPVRAQVLVRRGLVSPYLPETAADIPADFRADDGSWIGFSARARVLLVNTDQIATEADRPTSIQDLTDPRWRGRAAIANPAFGTTTMHMAALFSLWGSVEARDFLERLRANDVRLASSNGEVKRLVAAGEVAFGLTDTDDAAVAVREGAPVHVIYPDQSGLGTLLVPGAVVLIRGGPNAEGGRRLVEFLASREVERLLAFAPCAQVPLRADVETPTNVRLPDRFRAMPVDFDRLARVMEQIHPFLQDWAEGRTSTPPVVRASGPALARPAHDAGAASVDGGRPVSDAGDSAP